MHRRRQSAAGGDGRTLADPCGSRPHDPPRTVRCLPTAHGPDVRNGGFTVPGNLHPLCEYHHQIKTAGIVTLSVDDEGVERWSYPLGREAIAVIDSNFTEVEAAQQLLELLVDGSRAAVAAATCSDVGCDRKGSTRHGGGGEVDDAQPPV